MEGFLECTLCQQLLDQLSFNSVRNIVACLVKLCDRLTGLSAPSQKSREGKSHFVIVDLCHLLGRLHIASGDSPGEIDKRGHQLGITVRRLAQIAERSLVFTSSQKHVSTVPARLRIERSASDRFVKRSQRTAGIAYLVSQQSELRPEAIVGWSESHSALKFIQ